MRRFNFKKGEINYSDEQKVAILMLARKVAYIMNKLSEKDARVIAFAIDPTLDRYVLGGWDKDEIIQEAVEDMAQYHFDPRYLTDGNPILDNLLDMADSIQTGIY